METHARYMHEYDYSLTGGFLPAARNYEMMHTFVGCVHKNEAIHKLAAYLMSLCEGFLRRITAGLSKEVP